MKTTLDNIAFKAKTHPKHRFQNLYGLLNTDRLYQSWGQLNKQAAPGIDGMTINIYQQRLLKKYKPLKSGAETEMLSGQ